MTRLDEFNELVQLESDDCIEWPGCVDGKGYGRMSINGRMVSVNRLALEHRVGPPPPRHEAAHGPCHNRRCMNYRHLRWATRVENAADQVRDGTDMRGTKHPLAKLTDDKVREIRWKRQSGWSYGELAAHFDLNVGYLHRVVNRQIWAHV